MANRPLKSNLPADLPDNWTNGNIVAPEGSSVGLTTQHGYNYLMQQVNAAQTAANTINAAFDGLAASNQLPAQNKLVYTLGYSKSGTTHALTGLSGVSGTVSCVFTATAAYAAGDTFTVDGVAYTIQLSNGEEPEDNLFVSGASVPVVVDTAGKKVNFKAAGGKKLPAETTAIVKMYRTDGTFVVPQTGKYKITVIGHGGDGGSGKYKSTTSTKGAGGCSGGVAQKTILLTKGQSIPITASANASFGSYLSATKAQDSSYDTVGTPGKGTGGDVNYNGSKSTGTTGAGYTDTQIGKIGFLAKTGGYGGGEDPGEEPSIPTDSGFFPYGTGGGGGGVYDGFDSTDRFGQPGANGAGAVVIVELVV